VTVVAVLTVALGIGATVAVGILALVQPSSGPTVDAEVGASADGYTVWARNDDGQPVRWDPCSPVRIVVGSPGAPPTYPTAELRRDVEVAAATLADATGLDIVVEDTVEEVPDGDRSTVEVSSDGRTWAPVLIGWRTPGEGGMPLRDVDRAVAVPVAVGPAGAQVYVTAQVVLNPERTDLVPGTADRGRSWGATVLHELAHVLGLGHVDDARQLMHTYPGRGPVTLGDGDLAGLAAVGAREGSCLPVPRPQELEVELPSS
jgi:hypothetical protein